MKERTFIMDGCKISDMIWKARVDKGYSQEELSAALSSSGKVISREKVKNWELGQRAVKAEDIYALSKCLGVSADYLLGLSRNRTVQGNERESAEYTGLSEKAVKTAHDLATAFGGAEEGLLQMLSAIIEDDSLTTLLQLCFGVARARYFDSDHIGFHSQKEHEDFAMYRASKTFEGILDRAIKAVFHEQETAIEAFDAGWDEGWKEAERTVTDEQG